MKSGNRPVQKPERLRAGDTIGVAAPAGPFDAEQFGQGLRVLESMGFDIKVPENILRADGFLSGSDAHRTALMHELFLDDSIKGIICARGGYGSMRVLGQIDYQRLQQHPKVFVGFSDITALLVTLHARCGLVTFHGPMVTTLARADRQTVQALAGAVSGDRPVTIAARYSVVIRPGRCSGTVLGGNLATLCHLLGTPFAPDFTDCILFLEETNEAPYRVDRMLFQMQQAGCFKGAKGIALGSFDNCGNRETVIRVAERIFQAEDLPVLAGFEVGHGQPSATLPMGLRATLDTRSRTLTYDEAGTKP